MEYPHMHDDRELSRKVKEPELPEAATLTLCVSVGGADVIETSGLPSSASSADDDAVIAAAPEFTTTSATQEVAEIPPEGHKVEEDDEDESEYEYEDDDDVAFSGFLATAPVAALPVAKEVAAAPARIVEEVAEESENRKKWREPTRAAVNMSLRAQSETSGGKRRLAQDLYRIMNQDTEDAGFSLSPKSEDSMDKWTIKLFQFDEDSKLAKDLKVLGMDHVELEMSFPDQYPFEPPFVRVVRPRFKRQTGFVMSGALCMELLTKDGWNPINDIESVIVSVRSLLVVGDGRLQAASELSESRYQALLDLANGKSTGDERTRKRLKGEDGEAQDQPSKPDDVKPISKGDVGGYSVSEAQAAYSHLSDYHKKKGWDSGGWWARKG